MIDSWLNRARTTTIAIPDTITLQSSDSSSPSSSSSGASASANNEVSAPPPASASHNALLSLALLRTNNQDGISAADVEMQAVPPKGGGAKEEPSIEIETGRPGRSTREEGGRGEAARGMSCAETAASTKAPGKVEACLRWVERPSCIGKICLVWWCLGGVIVALVLYRLSHHQPIFPLWMTGKDDEDA